MIRVLVTDDSPTARALLVAVLAADPEVQVIGEARDGAAAVEMTGRLRPDVVTMDVQMPGLNGFEATKEIMATVPTPIVIVTASALAREVETSMHALRAGALTVVAKPPGPESPGFEDAARNLLFTVKAMAQVKVIRHRRPGPGAPPAGAVRGRVVAVATSTGGPAALHQMLSALPGDFPAPVLVVQHISPGFVGGLADWLNKTTDLRVKVAEDREVLAARTVYLAPDGLHLGVADAAVRLSTAPAVGGFRPSATFLFESVARVSGRGVVGVILTGMGEDGVDGLRAVRHAGGRVLAQDEPTSVVFGMPGAAVAAGVAEQVLPLEAIAPRLVELMS